MTLMGSSVRTGGSRRRCSAWRTVGGLALMAGLSPMLAPTALRAQSLPVPVAVSITVAPVVFISSSGSFTFNTVADADYMAGYMTSTSGPTLSHRANVPYKITMQPSAATLVFSPYGARSDVDPGKSSNDLSIRGTTGGVAGAFVQFGPGGTQADFLTRPTRGAPQTTTLDARLALSYANDPPGTYKTTITFTIIAQ